MITHVTKFMQIEKPVFRALLLSFLLLFLFAVSLLHIFLSRSSHTDTLTARIYQNGILLETIDLSAVTQSYSFTVNAPDGGQNTIEVRPGAIGITDADCPDRLCVSMGYADSSLLPIVCLPHGLVIEIEEQAAAPDAVPDALSY